MRWLRGLRSVLRLRWFRAVASVLAGMVGVAVVGYVGLKLAPDWFADDRLPDATCRNPSDKNFSNCLEAAKAQADDRRAVTTATLAILAGSIATIGAIFTGLSYRLNRAGQITERFTRATDQLGSPALDVRVGGIYALERIARDSKSDHPQVVEVLTAYVREHAPWPPTPATDAGVLGSQTPALLIEVIRALERIVSGEETEAPAASASGEPSAGADPQSEPPEPPTDVQAAIRVLGRRKTEYDTGWTRPNLARTDLRRIRLIGHNVAQFSSANLAGAHLEGASIFYKAEFRQANLGQAHLTGTKFASSDFSSANLTGADFRDADLGFVDFSYADLRGANLEGTKFLLLSLSDVKHDAATRWPEGFDPESNGAPPADTDKDASDGYTWG
jgi:hypothetical protein